MIQHRIGPRGLVVLLTLAVLAPGTWALMNGEAEKASGELAPSAEQERAAEEIVDRLDSHYRELTFNDELSARVWQNYLDSLDPNRVYFTQGDIKSFRPVREKLDDQLADGELSAGFNIFRVYRQRMDERLNFLLDRLDQGLDSLAFDKEETLRVDRADAPWPKDETALHDL
jgi:carboxyl-terminal processing protease